MVTGIASPVRQWWRAITLMIGSNAHEMKSANWYSTIGRSPTSAAPAARPVNPVSAIGVSITRRGPNFSRKPFVTLKAPPNWPTSSPIRKTSGSASISDIIAAPIASRYVTPPVSALVGIDTLLHRARVRHGIGERLLAGVDRVLPSL